MHYIPPTDENLITRPPSMPIPYIASPPSVRLFFAQYRTEAYCTVSEILSICNEHTGGNHIDTSLHTGVDNLMYLPITNPAFPPRTRSKRFLVEMANLAILILLAVGGPLVHCVQHKISKTWESETSVSDGKVAKEMVGGVGLPVLRYFCFQ